MNKIDFPTNVELPLRGGGKALLYEFFDRHWWGRATLPGVCNNGWFGCFWDACGTRQDGSSEASRSDIVWTPPKRKVWIIWGSDNSLTMISAKSDIAGGYAARGLNVQEVEES